MRWCVCFVSAAALAACTPAGETVETSEAEKAGEASEASEASETVELTLSGTGLAVSGGEGAILAFGSPRETAEEVVAAILGDAISRQSNEECGAGPMQFSAFAEGLTLNFQDDALVGWFLSDDADGTLATDKGIGLSSVIGDFESAHLASRIEESTLGIEAYSESDGIGALIADGAEGETITDMYAGTNCFFR